MERIHANVHQNSLTGKTAYRNKLELLRSRAELLTGQDKLLLTMYLQNGNSFRQMARLIGVNEGTVARKIRKITKRLFDGKYLLCLQNRDKLDKFERVVARDYFLTGLSIRKIAAKRLTTYYKIYITLKRIRTLIETTDRPANKELAEAILQSA